MFKYIQKYEKYGIIFLTLILRGKNYVKNNKNNNIFFINCIMYINVSSNSSFCSN